MEAACVLLCMVGSLVTAEDRIIFPDEREAKACKDCEIKIPLEMALRLNTITDENQLFREFIKEDEVDGGVEMPFVKAVRTQVEFSPDSSGVTDRFGGVADEPVARKAVSKPKPAGCIPELRSVSLRQSEDPWIYYWPSCTRVEQCGGCCSHQLLSCQPVEVETLNFQVVVTEYVGNQLLYKGKEIVNVDKHTKCKCDCIVKEKDCNTLQEYRKGECRCVCMNKDAESKCNADNATKHWNADKCACECHSVFECSAGTYFSHSSCSCESIPDESSLADRFSYSSENVTFSRRPPPPRRRWPPKYSFGTGK